jgi:hypothetical protein
MSTRRRTWIKGSFVVHRREMRSSLAWLALPWAARRFIDRLELEHMGHAGTENGNLVCTYDNLAEMGARSARDGNGDRVCGRAWFRRDHSKGPARRCRVSRSLPLPAHLRADTRRRPDR